MKRFYTKAGFTLVELLIAIAVLAILAGGVLVAINPAKRQNQAKDATIRGDIGEIAIAAAAYFSAQSAGSYPLSLNALVSSGDLKNVPVPPQGGSYTYVVSPQGCSGDALGPCTAARISQPLNDPALPGNLWCWQSVTGRAQELDAASCTP